MNDTDVLATIIILIILSFLIIKVILNYLNKTKINRIFPADAHSFEVFHMSENIHDDVMTAFIGYKLKTGCFHYIKVPYTGFREFENNFKEKKVC